MDIDIDVDIDIDMYTYMFVFMDRPLHHSGQICVYIYALHVSK